MSMYEIRGYEEAQRQYDNQVPERYDLIPIFKCEICGTDIFDGDGYLLIKNSCYCKDCVHQYSEEFESEVNYYDI